MTLKEFGEFCKKQIELPLKILVILIKDTVIIVFLVGALWIFEKYLGILNLSGYNVLFSKLFEITHFSAIYIFYFILVVTDILDVIFRSKK